MDTLPSDICAVSLSSTPEHVLGETTRTSAHVAECKASWRLRASVVQVVQVVEIGHLDGSAILKDRIANQLVGIGLLSGIQERAS
jgi:CxxC motif-containing protein (DUF1111 family)